MTFCLLHYTLIRVNDENGSICIGGACNHVTKKFLMARCIYDYIFPLRCLKIDLCRIYGYTFFPFFFKGVERPSETYHEIEAAARAAVLEAGGSLSHHHGVGTLRAAFLPEVLSEAALDWRLGARAAIDPKGVLAARTLRPAAPSGQTPG